MAEEKSKRTSQNPFIDLAWEDLINWAGDKIVDRGRTYQRNGNVSDLGVAPDGTLLSRNGALAANTGPKAEGRTR